MKINTRTQTIWEKNLLDCGVQGIEVIPGIWMNGKTYWFKPEVETIIPEEGISVYMKKEENTSSLQLYRTIITNYRASKAHVKLLIQNRHLQCSQHFSFISPFEKVAFHLDNQLVYLANGYCQEKTNGASTIQPLKNVFDDTIWTCAEKGYLKYNPMGKEDAVSLFLYEYNFRGKEALEGKSWVISGDNEEELIKLNASLLKTY